MTISPPPLDDYRILREGEVIEEGDEVSLQGSELPWAKALHIGQRAPCSSFPFARIYRRRSKVNEYNREVNDKRGWDGSTDFFVCSCGCGDFWIKRHEGRAHIICRQCEADYSMLISGETA